MTEPRPSTFVNPQDENYVTQVPDPRQRAVMADSVVRYRRADRLAIGDAVPSLALTRLTDGVTVALSDLVSAQPLMLIFGSYT